MHDDRSLIEARLARVLDERVRPAIYPETVPLQVLVCSTAGEPVLVADGIAAPGVPIEPGQTWGPPWGTSWFGVTGTVPAHWAGRTVEALLDLGFDQAMPGFQCEGLVYRPDGSPVKGLNPRNQWVRIGDPVAGGEPVRLHVEAAANPIVLSFPSFAPTPLGDRLTAGDEPQYRLGPMLLAVFDEQVWNLANDLEVLAELMPELPADSARRWQLLRAVDRALDRLDLQAINATAAAARAELAALLASPAESSAHRISAVGHAHIDSAWLWPQRETVRKVARTAANMTGLLADHPEFVFTMSQAQQFAWIAQHRPEVYAEVKAAVAAGRFVPVGGMWVESDTNMPGSEAMARQFVHGKRFFLDEFGIECDGAWLPDTFGFAAGLPQIIRAARQDWLLTQKISWSRTNTFPHHTFHWEGIDGSQVFTHFPPVDTYNCAMLGSEIAHAARNFREKGVAGRSLAPTGLGDGGGGTTREMIAKAARLRDLEGSARVSWQAPSDFFADARAEYEHPPVWVGELYLELHRATLTSQARTKRGNRRCEHLLYEAELWSTTAAVRGDFGYPFEALDRLWKTVLLHQFHDILPGSSIAWVHREAEQTYAAVAAELEHLIEKALLALGKSGVGRSIANPAPHARRGVPAGGSGPPAGGPPVTVAVTGDGGYLIANGVIEVAVDHRGLIVSLIDLATGREAVAPGRAANLLQLHPDLPNMWDAWDVDRFYRNVGTDLDTADELVLQSADNSAVVLRVSRSFGASRVTQWLRVHTEAALVEIETELDWHEREKFLKAAFPLDVHADRYAAETQFGHLYRPTHTNTSWEFAKFEACQHRFLQLGEPGWGVAIVTDGGYGHDVSRTVRAEDGGTTVTARLSLLRAPRFPDPEADQGRHLVRYGVAPGAGIAEAVREGYALNLPERPVGDAGFAPLVRLDGEQAVLTAVKLADDRSGDLVIRLYESHGARGRVRLSTDFRYAEAVPCDLLERPWQRAGAELAVRRDPAGGDAVELGLRPFELVTVRLVRSRADAAPATDER